MLKKRLCPFNEKFANSWYTVFPKGISISCYSQNVLLQGKCLYSENKKANKGPGK